MYVDEEQESHPVAYQYLVHLQALAGELESAMQAVGANALSRLERSVQVQQQLCASLERLGGGPNSTCNVAMERPESGFDRPLAQRIRAAAESLKDLNARYASLLQHSGDSVRLFSCLCRSYTGNFQATAVASTGHQVWSCEL